MQYFTETDKRMLDGEIKKALCFYDLTFKDLYDYLVEDARFPKFVEGRGEDVSADRIADEKRELRNAVRRLENQEYIWLNTNTPPRHWCIAIDCESPFYSPEGPHAWREQHEGVQTDR